MAASENLLRMQATILGTLLRSPDHMGEAAAELQPELFDGAFCRPIYEAMCRLHFAGAPIDRVTVLHELGEDYAEAVEAVLKVGTGDLRYYCAMLKEQGRLEAMREEAVGLSMAQELREAEVHLARLNTLAVERQAAQIISAAAAADAFCDRVARAEKPEYLPWGLPKLDRLLYAQKGDFIVLGGYPSAGKTLLSVQFALTMAEKYRVGFFSLETGPEKLSDRIISHLARVPLARIKERKLGQSDWAALTRACARLYELKLDLIDAGGMTVRDIRAVSLNRRYEVIFVDYLQLVNARGKNRYEEVTSISLGLHELARANRIAVIALAQLSRPEQTKAGRGGEVKLVQPTMSSFRESGQIEQDADVALLLYPANPNDNRGPRILKIGKNKEGERDRLDLEFDGATQTLRPAKAKEETAKPRAQVPGQGSFEELTAEDTGPLPF